MEPRNSKDPLDCAPLMESLDRLGVGYYRSDVRGQIVAVNTSGAKIYGYTPEEMISGVTTRETNVDNGQREVLTALLERDGCATVFSVPGRHKSGRTIFVNASIHSLTDSQGQPDGYEGVFTDATAQVELDHQREEALARHQRANVNLEHLTSFQEGFLAALAHDLQTPPVVIQGMSELLIRGHYGPLKEPQDKAVRTIHRNVLQFSQMMEQLLDFSRLLNSRARGPRTPFPIQESVGRALKQARSEWQNSYVRFSIDLPDDPLPVPADSPSLDFLAKNLLLNAAAFTRPGYELKGSVASAGNSMCMKIVVEALRPNLPLPSRLVQKFFVIPARGEEEQGATLPIGLAAGSYLARLLGGDLSVAPSGTAGLEIILTLPLAGGAPGYAPAPRDAERTRRARTSRETARKTRSPRRQ
jgi:PAS domain S-box-containing protein